MFEGDLVDLVPYGKAFKDQEHRWLNNESTYWGMLGERPIFSKAEIERWQDEQAAREMPQDRRPIWFGIRTKSGVLLGDVELGFITPHHRLAMIGIAIGEREYWGGGYGTDALLLIMEYAFDWLDFHRLWLHTLGSNVRMQRSAEKVGYREEARWRKCWFADGQWVDGVVYGMLQAEWPGREALAERLGLGAREGVR